MTDHKDLDDFFREKLSPLGNPDPKPHWEAAEALIESGLRNRFIKRELFYAFFTTIIFATIFSWPWNKTMDSPMPNSNKNTKNDLYIKQLESDSSNSTLASIAIKTSIRNKSNENKIGKKAYGLSPDLQQDDVLPTTLSKSYHPEKLDYPAFNKQQITPLHFTDVIRAKSITRSSIEDETSKNIKQIKIQLLSRNSNQWQFGIATTNGLSLYNNTAIRHAQKRNENPLTATSHGIVGIAKRKNINLRFGVSNLKLTEQTNYTSNIYNYSYDTTYVIVNKQFDTTEHGKNTALVKKEITTTIDTSEKVKCQNCHTEFSYIHIPLSIQYEFGKSRLKYFGEIGLGVSLLNNTKGLYTTNPTNILEDLNYSVESISKSDMNNVLISLNAQIGLKYRLTSQLSISGSCGYSTSQTSMMRTYEQSFNLKTVNIGAEWMLKNK